MGVTSVILFFHLETVWEGLSLMVCKLETYRNTRSNLLCQDHGVSHWYFLFCWRCQLHCYMNDCMKTWWSNVLTNLQMLNWGYLCPLQLYLRQEIPQKIFCSQNIYSHYGNLLHLMDLFLLPTSWILSTLFKIQHFFPSSHHHYKFVTFPFICQWHCSCVSLYSQRARCYHCSLILWLRTAASYKANRFSQVVNRLLPQSDW